MTIQEQIAAHLNGTAPAGGDYPPLPAPPSQYVPFDPLDPGTNCPPDAQYYQDVLDVLQGRIDCAIDNGCWDANNEPPGWNTACLDNHCNPGLRTGLLAAFEAMNGRCAQQ